MNLDESKAHLAKSYADRPLGLSWDKIESMQGGKLRRISTGAARARAAQRKCPKCGGPSKSTCILPLCKNCKL
jgi:hypothetical protein